MNLLRHFLSFCMFLYVSLHFAVSFRQPTLGMNFFVCRSKEYLAFVSIWWKRRIGRVRKCVDLPFQFSVWTLPEDGSTTDMYLYMIFPFHMSVDNGVEPQAAE